MSATVERVGESPRHFRPDQDCSIEHELGDKSFLCVPGVGWRNVDGNPTPKLASPSDTHVRCNATTSLIRADSVRGRVRIVEKVPAVSNEGWRFL